MVTQDDIIKIELPIYAVQLAHYQYQQRILTSDGWDVYHKSIKKIDRDETYMDQMLSEMAFSIFLFGYGAGVDHFMDERNKRNLDPHTGDNGNDIVKAVDVKSRRKTESFNSRFINGNMLNYDLILRDYDIHGNGNQIYVQVIQEYDESLRSKDFVEQTALIWFTGWERFRNFGYYPDGLNASITDELWKITAKDLLPMSKFPRVNSQDLTLAENVSLFKTAKKLPDPKLPVPN